MKKHLIIFTLLFFSSFFLFSESYRIVDAEFDITSAKVSLTGKTKEYPLKTKYPYETKKVFNSREELEVYIADYQTQLFSTRLFKIVEIDYDAIPSQTADLNEVTLKIKIQDSRNFIIMPVPKYSSGDGVSLKVKIKDYNFLGTLNQLNTEIAGRYNQGDIDAWFNLSFDYPFKAGPFNATFVNDYEIGYEKDVGDDVAGMYWTTKTGISLSLPIKRVSLSFGLNQYTYRDVDYEKYGDMYYFKEQFTTGLGINLVTLPNFTSISYGPSASISDNWDPDGLHPDNTDLYNPQFSWGHSISNGKVTWNDNMRKGYNVSLSNSYSYNYYYNDLYPTISFESKFFYNFKLNDQEIWNRLGICSDLYFVHCFNLDSNTKKHGAGIDGRLRGIMDTAWFGCNDPSDEATTAIVLNMDFPISVFTAYLPVEFLNLNCQFNPFFDMALIYDCRTKRLFAWEDGLYCAGIEMLVYPLRWSSITVRASLGIDIKSNIFVEGIKKNKEIFIGLGLHY